MTAEECSQLEMRELESESEGNGEKGDAQPNPLDPFFLFFTISSVLKIIHFAFEHVG